MPFLQYQGFSIRRDLVGYRSSVPSGGRRTVKGECFTFSGREHGLEMLENVSRLIQLLKVITAVKREAL